MPFIDPEIGIQCFESEKKIKAIRFIEKLSKDILNERIIQAQADILADEILTNHTIPYLTANLLNGSSKNIFVLLKDLFLMIGRIFLKRRRFRNDQNAACNIFTNETHRSLIIRALNRQRTRKSNLNINEDVKHTLEMWRIL